ncbi:hypothetical protein ACJIZ3_016829 [Penstemon smallii]|uniref:Uncharacterized protein n=1 Tax=Penstemon smallii TaxID=265156 RepID=A0ABD3STZ5_9LAMI
MMAKANGLGLFFKNEEEAYLTEPYTYQTLHQARHSLDFSLYGVFSFIVCLFLFFISLFSSACFSIFANLSLILSSFQGQPPNLLYINMDACIQKILDTWMMGISLFTVLKSSSNRKVFRNLFKRRQDKRKV